LDTIYLLLKFVHVAAIIVWVGGIFALTVLNARSAVSGEAATQAAMGRLSEYFGSVAIGPAMIIAVLAGIATAWRIGFPFSSLWIVWGLIAFVLSGALIGFIGRTARQFGELPQGSGPAAARAEAIRGRLMTLNVLNILILASAVWVMIFKPTL
jgi:uncharacterized membrane protein